MSSIIINEGEKIPFSIHVIQNIIKECKFSKCFEQLKKYAKAHQQKTVNRKLYTLTYASYNSRRTYE